MKSKRLKIGLSLLVFICLFPLLSRGLDSWRYATSDAIDRAGIDTQRQLTHYEGTQDAREIRSWLTDGPTEALGTQVRLTFGSWALKHPKDFVFIVEGLPEQKKREFIVLFAGTLGQSGQFDDFKRIFARYKSKVVQGIIEYGESHRPMKWPNGNKSG